MKPVTLNQLLFHTKCDTLSFYRSPEPKGEEHLETFLKDMHTQLLLQGKGELAQVLEKQGPQVKRIVKSHPGKSHGFFLSSQLTGYLELDFPVEDFCIIGTSFHVRPLLEELFTNPEFMVVNVSLYDIKVYRGDFTHLEIVQHYEFEHLPKNLMDMPSSRVYAPQYLGLLPYKTLLALKALAHKIQDLIQYHSMPVIVTGLSDVRDIFLRYFDKGPGIITSVSEDFFEQTCMQVLERCKSLRPLVLDYYSAELKERLKRMIKSKRLLTDLTDIVPATLKGQVVHLVIPSEGKLWGSLDLSTGSYEIHKKATAQSVDIFNELADAVIKQGGRIQFLRPHFFPSDAQVLALLKG